MKLNKQEIEEFLDVIEKFYTAHEQQELLDHAGKGIKACLAMLCVDPGLIKLNESHPSKDFVLLKRVKLLSGIILTGGEEMYLKDGLKYVRFSDGSVLVYDPLKREVPEYFVNKKEFDEAS